MANPSCPRCFGHTVLDSRKPMAFTCRDCDHTFVRREPPA